MAFFRMARRMAQVLTGHGPTLPAFRYLETGTLVAAPGAGPALTILAVAVALLAAKVLALLAFSIGHGFEIWSASAAVMLGMPLAVAAMLGARLRGLAARTYAAHLIVDLSARGVATVPRSEPVVIAAEAQILHRQKIVMLAASLVFVTASAFLFLAHGEQVLLACQAIAGGLVICIVLLTLQRASVAGLPLPAFREVMDGLSQPKRLIP